jgi:hypothetical protein
MWPEGSLNVIRSTEFSVAGVTPARRKSLRRAGNPPRSR